MAPPDFPNGITLYSLGYATLKYPDLPAYPPVPVGNQIGMIQRVVSPSQQNHLVAQAASQYLTAVIEYQTSDAQTQPLLHDKTNPQYCFSTALCMLNFLNMNPDVCKRITKTSIIPDCIEKLLDPDFESAMKAVVRTGGPNYGAASFEDEFGSLLQFVSTLLLYKDEMDLPRLHELVPKLKHWKSKYKNKYIGKVTERLISQMDMDAEMIRQMRTFQTQTLVCGATGCGKRESDGLTACAACRIQRYCSREHQKKDWKYHKHICQKGLVEENTTNETAETKT